jgi:hypothetical protein
MNFFITFLQELNPYGPKGLYLKIVFDSAEIFDF